MEFPDGNVFDAGVVFLGNGINNYGANRGTTSWAHLLTSLAVTSNRMRRAEAEEILGEGGVSYPEFFDIIQLGSSSDVPQMKIQGIKQDICKAIRSWQPEKQHERIVQHCSAHSLPILTTNFDTTLAKSSEKIVAAVADANKKRKRRDRTRPIFGGAKGFTDYYPWHSYFSDHVLRDSHQEFAIRHVHGIECYPRSLRLGLSDYMGFVQRARTWLQSGVGNPFNDRRNLAKWRGTGSWIDLFLHQPMVIVGLSLEVQEHGLRWLLLEREKLHRKYRELRRPFYFATVAGQDSMGKGKRHFIETVGGKVIAYPTYDSLYVDAFKK